MRRTPWRETAFGVACQRGDWTAIVRPTETGWCGGVMLSSMLGRMPMPTGVRSDKLTAIKVLLAIELKRLNGM